MPTYTGHIVDRSADTTSDTIYGLSSSDDTLTGGSANDYIYGYSGNDSLNGGAGDDYLNGGDGDDTYVFDSAGDLAIDSGGTQDEVQSYAADVDLSVQGVSIEFLALMGTGNINGTGNNLANYITGNIGNNYINGGGGVDVIDAGDGDDTLDGGTGADKLYGGLGDDLYYFDNVGDKAYDTSGSFDEVRASTVSVDLSTQGGAIEYLTLEGSTNINGYGNGLANFIVGNDGANELRGYDGNDTIFAGLGNDTLDGGTGSDLMYGEAGDDVYIFDSTSDKAIDSSGLDEVQSSTVSVDLSTKGTAIEYLTLLGTANINGTGNVLDNTIVGNYGNNWLNGGDGNDLIGGDAGDDVIDGGTGLDTVYGGTGNDVITGGIGNDRLYGEENDDLISGDDGDDKLWGGNGNDDLLGGIGNDSLSGDAGDDILIGNAGADTLLGGAGADQLQGGADNDSLNGGTNGDIYYFNAGFGADTLTDVDSGTVDLVNRVNVDEAHFSDNDYNHLWLKKVGTGLNDLEISVVGSTDKVTIQGWFSSSSNQIEEIYDDATGHRLDASKVSALVSAMAGFSPQDMTSATGTLAAARDAAWVAV